MYENKRRNLVHKWKKKEWNQWKNKRLSVYEKNEVENDTKKNEKMKVGYEKEKKE